MCIIIIIISLTLFCCFLSPCAQISVCFSFQPHMRMHTFLYMSMYSDIYAHVYIFIYVYVYNLCSCVYIFYNKCFLHFLREIVYRRYQLDKRAGRQATDEKHENKKNSAAHSHTHTRLHAYTGRATQSHTHTYTIYPIDVGTYIMCMYYLFRCFKLNFFLQNCTQASWFNWLLQFRNMQCTFSLAMLCFSAFKYSRLLLLAYYALRLRDTFGIC